MKRLLVVLLGIFVFLSSVNAQTLSETDKDINVSAAIAQTGIKDASVKKFCIKYYNLKEDEKSWILYANTFWKGAADDVLCMHIENVKTVFNTINDIDNKVLENKENAAREVDEWCDSFLEKYGLFDWAIVKTAYDTEYARMYPNKSAKLKSCIFSIIEEKHLGIWTEEEFASMIPYLTSLL